MSVPVPEIDGQKLAGIGIELLMIFMQDLNFTVKIVSPTDGGTYGVLDLKVMTPKRFLKPINLVKQIFITTHDVIAMGTQRTAGISFTYYFDFRSRCTPKHECISWWGNELLEANFPW